MRRLAHSLAVTPMALYKHVANREELIDGMVDTVIAKIPAPAADPDWRRAVRGRILSARTTIRGHPWVLDAIETRTSAGPAVLSYMDSLMGMLTAGGFSPDLVHNAMHALSTRMWGFTRDVFPTPSLPADPDQRVAMLNRYAAQYPNIVALAATMQHNGTGCDNDAEFGFALDLMLDGLERVRVSAG